MSLLIAALLSIFGASIDRGALDANYCDKSVCCYDADDTLVECPTGGEK